MPSAKPSTIDDYLRGLDEERRTTLERVRQTIKALRPDAEECIRYAVPAFRVEGAVVAGFSATAKGCSYFPFSGTTLTTLKEELSGYETSKGAVHFASGKPLPKRIIQRLLRTRLEEVKPSKR